MDEEAEAGVAEDLRLGRVVGQPDGVLGEERDGRFPGRRRLRRLGRTPDGHGDGGGQERGQDRSADTGGRRERHGGLLRAFLLMERGGKIKYNHAVTSKERMLRALAREKPDRLPVTVHQWQAYHLDTYLGGASALEAFGMFGLDASIQYFQDMGQFWLTDADFTRFSTPDWRDEIEVADADPDHRVSRHTITTPGGVLTYRTEGNRMTTWVTEYLVKHDDDIRLIEKYMPAPRLDPVPVGRAYDEVGDRGILRGFVWGDQAGCWQHAACLDRHPGAHPADVRRSGLGPRASADPAREEAAASSSR